MPARTPQDRKPPAKKTTARKTSTSARKTTATKTAPGRKPDAARMRAASAAALDAAQTSDVVSDADNDDLAAEALIERPEGLPELRPLVALPRRTRAAFVRGLAAMRDRLPAEFVEQVTADGDASDAVQAAAEAIDGGRNLHIAAVFIDIAADYEDLLALAAVDEDAYRAWAAAASDEELQAAFSWYNAQNPAGEASASPS